MESDDAELLLETIIHDIDGPERMSLGRLLDDSVLTLRDFGQTGWSGRAGRGGEIEIRWRILITGAVITSFGGSLQCR